MAGLRTKNKHLEFAAASSRRIIYPLNKILELLKDKSKKTKRNPFADLPFIAA